ncbi:MAG TPA: 1,4-dihydroxy-6-naphthoate synthase [Bacteroidales bacterium]|nr:MAG: hypothetical protein A2X11_09095 [Bacteroidetes bacterium GWE2_42_24]OFY26871.1 MAG: hypothetical protein A2X09_11210 [Bacteroidetes bacterium GWF2_43_11]PKP27472.1 MAG: 1,4-dihydroxy-6-naphthoate synthase [Bacteroidetes bacterium HGW-Bacteroidetes-22]HAQ64759.1 1,4-dihydroxy-6-naphthoate synthase [Bacteroidales bacterium]HBZ67826.1 1,4-dihydroxy-6-naphthoate synthase [Bacteroidales bacterium]
MINTTLDLRFSSCPNDTFIFEALVNGRLSTESLIFNTMLADIDQLNHAAASGIPDVVKISYHAYAHLVHQYVMLDAGSALGYGVGPLLVALKPYKVRDLTNLTIAVPGEYTTAAMLLGLAFPDVRNTRVMLFSEIEEAILKGKVDAGVLIHEGRFTYAARGLNKLADLGELWELMTGLPIPLGGIAAKRSLGHEMISRINHLIKQSVEMAHRNPDAAMPYVSQHACEMDPVVMKKHIDLYVNAATLDVGLQGRLAVRYVIDRLAPGLPADFPLFASELAELKPDNC